MFVLEVVLVVVGISTVVGYGGGPPDGACDSMTPNVYAHGAEQQTTSCPYSLVLSKTTYSSGEQINVTLQGGEFIGFFIQPRPSKDTYSTYGNFNTPSGSRPACLGKTALCHNSKAPKNNFEILWTAPTDYQGNIVFVFTVVQSKPVFWVKQVSQTLTYQASTGPTQEPTSQGPTQPPTTTQTQGSSGTIDRDSACGVTVGCFPPECSTNCDNLVTWKDVGDDIEFTMHQKTASNNYFIAIGFSQDPKMGNDSVQDCVSRDGAVDVRTSYNPSKFNTELSPSNFGVQPISASYTNGILSCTFRRKKSVALVTGGGDASKFFDLDEDWYLLVANGNANGGFKNKHAKLPAFSQAPINFQDVKVTTFTTQAPGVSAALKKDTRCGDTIGCFHDCEGDKCDFLLTWNDNGDDVDLTLHCRQAGNKYCAIGLSSDKEMGDDSVFECVSNAGQAKPYVSYNIKNGNNNERLDTEQFGLTVKAASHQDGIVKCEFSRKKTAVLASTLNGRRKRAVPDASTFFDMDLDWYLLYAYGTSSGGFVFKHSTLPTVSSQKADFQQSMDLSAEGIDNKLVRTHGILMVVAWMFNAAVGILMARFYKDAWPEGMECFGDKRWFVIHRGFMISTFVLTVIGVVLIFVHVEGWVEIVGTGFQKSHPIIGIVVAALVFINPIMALFRPHPGTKYRPIFKAAHTLVGVAAYILSIVNIFSGVSLTAAHVPDYVRYILYAYCAWVFVIDMGLHVYNCSKSSGNKGEAYELKQHGARDSGAGSEQGVDTVKVYVFVVYALVVVGLVVAVGIVIGTADPDKDH